MNPTSKQSIVDRIGQATNVLVTVSANPSVDQLSACIGLTLFLNKLGKHATAVFSGDIPSTIEFLKPEATLEKTTDSLRDFIISLDKTKADKLRYKVEDKVVKIFITPYKTSISDKDFDFSQGDFNVDVVVALGVHNREDLDKAIIAHGRILHDATVISISNSLGTPLGTLDLQDDKASSLCEMVADIAEVLKPNSFDAQMATSLLTGIVSETKRFSNEKTSPLTMGLSAKLMAAGANQQLVATNLQAVPTVIKRTQGASKDGELNIDHSLDASEHPELEHRVVETMPTPFQQRPQQPTSPSVTRFQPAIRDVKSESHSPDDGTDLMPGSLSASSIPQRTYNSSPPTMGGTLTANTMPESLDSAVNPLNEEVNRGINQSVFSNSSMKRNSEDFDDKTLTDIEKTVHSPHVGGVSSNNRTTLPQSVGNSSGGSNIDAARNAVLSAAEESPKPVQSLGTTPMPLSSDLAPTGSTPAPSITDPVTNPILDSRAPNPINRGVQPPFSPVNRSQSIDAASGNFSQPTPPPVPPPMMPPTNLN